VKADQAVSRSDFARLLGVKPSYVTQLARDGRLVFDNEGRVLVDESRARIVATKDPAKSAVAARHAAARAPAAPEGAGKGEDAPQAPAEPPASGDYQDWRARTERAKALTAEMELARESADLLRADDVRQCISTAMTDIRARLEALPDLLAPDLVVIRDEPAMRARLADAIETVLSEASRALANLGSHP
jgi:phage terminase Nu1 subunit (DNA packaging protein)